MGLRWNSSQIFKSLLSWFNGEKPGRANFRTMTEANKADFELIHSQFMNHGTHLPDRIIAHLRMLEGDYGGFPVDRLTHCLQTATRAYRAGEDEEYVVCALLHDIGDTLATYNHGDLAAAILKPFVSEKNHWIVANHPVVQGYYFFHFIGLDRNLRDKLKDHPYYADAARFCELYDCPAFDQNYPTMSLEEFEPMLRRVFSNPNSILTKCTG